MAETRTTDDVAEGDVRTLDRLARQVRATEGVWSRDVEPGDWIIVATENSIYSMLAVGDGSFYVAGGWFAAEAGDTTRVRVVGCTWGGTAICTTLVAARGMFLEFSNGVRTSRVRDARLIRTRVDALH